MYQLLFFETTNGDTVFIIHYSNAHFMNTDIVESDSETNAIVMQYLIQIKTMNNMITCTHSLSVTQETAPHQSLYRNSMQKPM